MYDRPDNIELKEALLKIARKEADRIRELLKKERPHLVGRMAGLEIQWNDRRYTTAGVAYYATGVIQLSWRLFSRKENLWEFRETVIHEISHIIIPGGHTPEWRELCIFLGGSGERCHSLKPAARVSKRRFEVVCHKCKREFFVGRRLANQIQNRLHRGCGGSLGLKYPMNLQLKKAEFLKLKERIQSFEKEK